MDKYDNMDQYGAWLLARCSWTVQAGLLLLSERTSKMVCWGMKRQRALTTGQTRVTCHFQVRKTRFTTQLLVWGLLRVGELTILEFHAQLNWCLPSASAINCWSPEVLRCRIPAIALAAYASNAVRAADSEFQNVCSLKCAWICRQRNHIDIGHLLLWASLRNDT